MSKVIKGIFIENLVGVDFFYFFLRVFFCFWRIIKEFENCDIGLFS